MGEKKLKRSSISIFIKNYDKEKGFLKKHGLRQDTDGMKILRNFDEKLQLSYGNQNDVDLSIDEITELVAIIRNRYIRIAKTSRSYINDPKKLTNTTYCALIKSILYDPRISHVQKNVLPAFTSSHQNHHLLANENLENLFYTEKKIILRIEKDICSHIRTNGALSYSLPYQFRKKNGENIINFSPKELEHLENRDPGLKKIILEIKKRDVTYINSKSNKTGKPLSQYFEEDLFITSDKYCLIIPEVLETFEKEGAFKHPYTYKNFILEELETLLNLPRTLKIYKEKASELEAKKELLEKEIKAEKKQQEDMRNKYPHEDITMPDKIQKEPIFTFQQKHLEALSTLPNKSNFSIICNKIQGLEQQICELGNTLDREKELRIKMNDDLRRHNFNYPHEVGLTY